MQCLDELRRQMTVAGKSPHSGRPQTTERATLAQMTDDSSEAWGESARVEK